jgi:outer membrane protein assembly factor BamE
VIQKSGAWLLQTRQVSVVLVVWCSLLLSACFPGVYKLDIPQGNVLEKEKIDQVKTGMTKRQVRYVLGTPLLIDSFNQDRWDYYYSHRYYLPGNSEPILRQAQLTLFFEKGQLVKMDKKMPDDFFPPAATAAEVTPSTAVTAPEVPEPDLPETDMPQDLPQ